MKIIDFERKGNTVRFYLGEKTPEWGWARPDYKDYRGVTPEWLKPSDTFGGDDWEDRPYEHNAGRVYDEFIKGHKDIAFDFDDVVLEPCNGEYNSSWSKDDMVARKIPCIIVVSSKYLKDNDLYDWQVDDFEYALSIDGIQKYYFGDEMNEEN